MLPDAASIFVVLVGVHHTLPHIFLRVQEDDVQLGSEKANRRHSCTQTEKNCRTFQVRFMSTVRFTIGVIWLLIFSSQTKESGMDF